ncbi:T-complex protein 1 subunit delta [Hordeum vulgare]|nr:T-complex protein 1 subunit delta [Hordeum vulgare]
MKPGAGAGDDAGALELGDGVGRPVRGDEDEDEGGMGIKASEVAAVAYSTIHRSLELLVTFRLFVAYHYASRSSRPCSRLPQLLCPVVGQPLPRITSPCLASSHHGIRLRRLNSLLSWPRLQASKPPMFTCSSPHLPYHPMPQPCSSQLHPEPYCLLRLRLASSRLPPTSHLASSCRPPPRRVTVTLRPGKLAMLCALAGHFHIASESPLEHHAFTVARESPRRAYSSSHHRAPRATKTPGSRLNVRCFFMQRIKILLIKVVKRDEIGFITKTFNCLPIANIQHFHEDKVGYADVVEKVSAGDGKIVKIAGIRDTGRTATVLVRGSNRLVID